MEKHQMKHLKKTKHFEKLRNAFIEQFQAEDMKNGKPFEIQKMEKVS